MKVVTTNLLNRFWKNGVLIKLEEKLDKDKIANNLTTTETEYVLDARQGKQLDDKIARQGKQLDDKIARINSNKLVSLDEVNLVTEQGFFVDAMAVKELSSKTIKYEIVPIVAGLSVGANTMLRQGVISEADLNKYLSKNKATKYIGFCTLDGGYGDQMQVTFTMYEKNLYCQVDNRFASNLTIYPSVCMLMV